MPLEVGRVCIKTVGREAGKYCVILKKINDSFLIVTGPKLLTGVKRRRANINHLQSTKHILEIKEDVSDEEVLVAFDKAGLISKLGLKKPSAAELKKEKTKTEEKKIK